MCEEKKTKSGLGWNKEEDRGPHGPVVWGVTQQRGMWSWLGLTGHKIQNGTLVYSSSGTIECRLWNQCQIFEDLDNVIVAVILKMKYEIWPKMTF